MSDRIRIGRRVSVRIGRQWREGRLHSGGWRSGVVVAVREYPRGVVYDIETQRSTWRDCDPSCVRGAV